MASTVVRLCVLTILVACLGLLLNGDLPGARGSSKAVGYSRAQPVLRALEAFRTDSGRYPDSMPQLAPKYLSHAYIITPKRALKVIPLSYAKLSTGFVLRFRYHGIGLTECSYDSTERFWECGIGF
jgi:hypothetical protein